MTTQHSDEQGARVLAGRVGRIVALGSALAGLVAGSALASDSPGVTDFSGARPEAIETGDITEALAVARGTRIEASAPPTVRLPIFFEFNSATLRPEARQLLEKVGGGGGMVIMARPIVEAVEHLGLPTGSPVILMSPSGKRFNQTLAHDFAVRDELTFVCGRYKGIDERVRELVITDEVSVGDYVLSGGELAAAVCIEATVRLVDDVLGNDESWETDSFEARRDHLLDCACYTRPVEYRSLTVPDVLLSGNHKEIEKWRRDSSLARTAEFRPDLLEGKN